MNHVNDYYTEAYHRWRIYGILGRLGLETCKVPRLKVYFIRFTSGESIKLT